MVSVVVVIPASARRTGNRDIIVLCLLVAEAVNEYPVAPVVAGKFAAPCPNLPKILPAVASMVNGVAATVAAETNPTLQLQIIVEHSGAADLFAFWAAVMAENAVT